MLWTANEMFAKAFPNQEAFDAHCEWFLRERRGGMVVNKTTRSVELHVSEGRWCADCPNCGGGLAGVPNDWPDPHSTCLTCGYQYDITYPTDHEDAERVLLARDSMANRNWRPDDETVGTLERENVLMGVD